MDNKERELLDGVKRGDEGAFDRIFEEYEKMVFRVAYGVVGEREAAKDVLQEVFVSVYKNLKGFAERSSLRTWIYRITFNAALAQTRKRSFLPLFDFLLHRPDRSDPATRAEQSELTERLRLAISRLPMRQRQAFVLRNKEGLSYAEMAEVLEAKVGTAKALVYQATNNLRRTLGEEKDDYL